MKCRSRSRNVYTPATIDLHTDPNRHKNGGRTASVGIRMENNSVKCFGCDSKPIGPVDFVMDVLGMEAADSALWIRVRAAAWSGG